MRCQGIILPSLIVSVLLTMPVMAQQAPIGLEWQHDIEGAKALAKQSGRLVLVHFWTPDCVPCMMLDRNVFNQPGVAGAIESQFVPVKLDANQNSGLAQSYGITRVPTDVIITPEGQVLGKLISPPTPSAYIAEIGQVAAQHVTSHGGGFASAATAAAQPALINDAYANLPFDPTKSPTDTATAQGAAGASPFQTPQAGFGHLASTTPGYYGTSQPGTSTTPALPAPGVAPASPLNGSDPPQPSVDRFQTPLSTSQPIAPSYHAGNAALVNSNAPAPSTAISANWGPQPAPAVVPNQFATWPPHGAEGANTTPSHATPPSAHTTNSMLAAGSGAYPAGQGSVPANSGSSTNAVAPHSMTTGSFSEPPLTPSPGPAATAQANELPTTPTGATGTEPLPIGFDGYCTVTMRNRWEWVEGNKQWGVNHRGRLYLFVGPTEQQQFLQNPDYYAPALSGIDVVMAIEHRQTIPGIREHSIDYDNQIYLFASEATLQQFTANPESYAAKVRQAMGIERGQLVR